MWRGRSCYLWVEREKYPQNEKAPHCFQSCVEAESALLGHKQKVGPICCSPLSDDLVMSLFLP